MSIWKQAALTVVVLLIAAACWVRFYPGASEILARAGLDWVPFVPEAPTETASAPGGRSGAGGGGRRPRWRGAGG